MKGRAGEERRKTMRQLVSCDEEMAGGEGFDGAEVNPLHEGAEAPRPARGVRRVGWLLVACGVALLPWLYVLATGLPATATAAHWPVAWVGLDALEALGLIATGLLAVRGDGRHALAAAATATLLVVDAWFDTATAAPGGDIATAVAMALGAELPLAALCGRLALRAVRGRGLSGSQSNSRDVAQQQRQQLRQRDRLRGPTVPAPGRSSTAPATAAYGYDDQTFKLTARVIQGTQAPGPTVNDTKYAYDSSGNPASVTDQQSEIGSTVTDR
ncbi:hypothetical protein [Streptomyces sp. NPDC006334]|uniref:hypothetical protein n=1 Tax=Streptomyces sp. NPDC006334 TaxID=3156754 RepID=UPI0033AFE540